MGFVWVRSIRANHVSFSSFREYLQENYRTKVLYYQGWIPRFYETRFRTYSPYVTYKYIERI